MASSSKPVLAVAAMMLIEEGLLQPGDDVAAYLPEFGEMQVAVLKEPAGRDISPWFVATGKVAKARCRSTAWCRRRGRSPSTIC